MSWPEAAAFNWITSSQAQMFPIALRRAMVIDLFGMQVEQGIWKLFQCN